MTYQPYLVANYSTGLDDRLKPWLSADDAQLELYDGYVYRGTLSKRQGYKYYAFGLRGNQPYTESRIVNSVGPVAMTGTINGTNRVFTFSATPPVGRGRVTITGSNPVQTFTDDGAGSFINAGNPIGTVDYNTGAISITFPVAPANGSTVTITYSFTPDDPVMMIASFYDATNTRDLIVASTTSINKYNSTLNILQDITTTPYTGDNFNFFSWINYPDPTDKPRLIFSNNKDPVQSYDGAIVANYAYTMNSSVSPFDPVTFLTCLHVTEFKDRLLMFRTTEGTAALSPTIYPRRIRISGTGANCDDFRSSATGAGFIDIPDNTWINGIAINRDNIIICTEGSFWTLSYTGNDTTPFVLNRIDETRGCQAPFSTFTYLNRTSAASTRGLVISDGYKVERQDDSIPDFSFDEINSDAFNLCFAGSVDADRDHYLIYPSSDNTESNRILTTNYDEDNYAIYRLPISCMGNYLVSFKVTWNDLLMFNNWAEFAAAYANWQSFAFTKGSPVSLAGGHHGEIWELNSTEGMDNTVMIRNITKIDHSTLEITTDWNNFSLNLSDNSLGADSIFLSGIQGMLEVNNQQFNIVQIINNNVFRVRTEEDTDLFGFYNGGGEASRVIPFSALFKQFNPFIGQDKKVRCGWIYMYVDSTGTSLVRNTFLADISLSNPAIVTTLTAHGLKTGDQISIINAGGMYQINNRFFFITVLSKTSFSLNDVDSTGYNPFTGAGFVSVSVSAKMDIDIFTNDRSPNDETQLNNLSQTPYKGTCTNLKFEDGQRKWYKVFINQVGKFIQFRFRNKQAGAVINIQATMFGFQPLGRIL